MAKRTILVASLLIALSYSVLPYGATAEVDDELSKQEQNNSQLMERLDKKVMEINGALDDYEKLNGEVEAVISGLNNLGLYFVNLQSSLISTKKLIADGELRRTRAESESTRAENERLKGLVAIDKSKVDELFGFINTENKWPNMLMSFIIGVLSSAAVTVGYVWYTKYNARRPSS
jgi:hypothetical protein